MLTRRGYTHCETDDVISLWVKDDDEICVFVETFPKITVNVFKEAIVLLTAKKKTHCILIYIDDVTTPVKEICKHQNQNPHVELFRRDELEIDLLAYMFQPKFELLSQEEVNRLEKRYGSVGFPIFKKSDPIVRYFNWPINSIIKIVPCNPDIKISFRRVGKN